mgnify:CR=1 FL=1
MRGAFLTLLITGIAGAGIAAEPDYRVIPGGSFASVLPPDGKDAPAEVTGFRLRAEPVTNAEFLVFVRANPQWRRDRVARLFAEPRYLSHWTAADALGDAAAPDQPVTQVSWFAARAYCASEKARLPTWHEWEFAAKADATRSDARVDPAWRERILGWYARPSSAGLAPIGQGEANLWGVRDLHGLIWEWVEDYASLMVSADNREQGDPDLLRFCGAGALSMQDRENYAVLMRVAMLSALKAVDTTRNLGFRCARDGLGATP